MSSFWRGSFVLGFSVLCGCFISERVSGKGPFQQQVAPPVFFQIGPKVETPDGDDEDLRASISLKVDSRLKRRIEAAVDLLKEQNWGDAVYVLQGLLDGPEDAIFEQTTEDGKTRWTSIKAEANRLIGSMPKEGLEVYELQWGAKARNLLQQAKLQPEERTDEELRSMTPAEILGRVAKNYLHTKAGTEAAELLATLRLQRGEPDMAVLHFKQLLSRPNYEASPLTLLKAAIACQMVGDENGVGQFLDRLEAVAPGGVRLGEERVSLDRLRAELAKVSRASFAIASAEIWPTFRGNQSRTAVGEGSTPFLDDIKWKQDITREGQTKQWIDVAARFVKDYKKEPLIPAFCPIAAGGKLVYRSYSGIDAVNLSDGKLAWEQVLDRSLYRLLRDGNTSRMLAQWWQLYGQSGKQQVLFENSLVGTLSTDGQLVYGVDDLPFPPYAHAYMFGRPQQFGALSDMIENNKLTAIELNSGKLRWELGGNGNTELDNSFFLGPPLPLSGKLYLLNEKAGELRLICLDPHAVDPQTNRATPKVVWMQKLASFLNPLQRDIGRRLHAAHLAYGEGVLVCSTNAGAVLGVDLLTQSLVWAYRYEEQSVLPTQPNRFVPYGMPSIELQWRGSAPIIHNGYVVFTAPDATSIHCVRIRTGERVWKKPRGNDLYLAGVFDDNVVIVGSDTCRSLDLATGRLRWKLDTGMPSGQGIASADGRYFLPLASSAGRTKTEPEVCVIDIAAGRIIARTKTRWNPHDNTRSGEVPGNLLFCDGKVISQTIDQVVAYPQLKVKLAEMNQSIAKDPNNPFGLTERAELRRHEGDLQGAIQDLRVALNNNPDDKTRTKARQLLYESYSEALQRNFNENEKYLADYFALCHVDIPNGASRELKRQLEEERDRRVANYYALVAKGKEKQGKLVEALENYIEFGKLGNVAKLVPIIDEPTAQARPNVWVQVRIQAMTNAAPELRKPLEENINRRWQAVRDSNDPTKLRQFINVFGAMSQFGAQARLRLAELLIEQRPGPRDFREAELQLLHVRATGDKQQAAQATEALARLMAAKNLLDDAAYFYRLLGSDYADVVVKDGKTGADFFNDLATDKRFLASLDRPDNQWSGENISAKEVPQQYRPFQQLYSFEPVGEWLPFHQRYQLFFNIQMQQLQLRDCGTNQIVWTQNVNRQNNNNLQYLYWTRSASRAKQKQVKLYYAVQGHLAVIQIGLRVFAVDLLHHQLLWEKAVGDDDLPISRNRHMTRTPDGDIFLVFPDGRSRRVAFPDVFEPGFVCLQDFDSLEAIDPLTGTPLWSRSDINSWNRLFGNSRYVCMAEVLQNGNVNGTRVLDARNGMSLPAPDFSEQYKSMVSDDGGLLYVRSSDAKGNILVQKYQVSSGKVLWQATFSPNAVVAESEVPGFVAVVEPRQNGKLTILDMRQQKEVMHASLRPEHLKDIENLILLEDYERFYLAVSQVFRAQVNVFGNPQPGFYAGIASVPVNGWLYAFAKNSGQLRWIADVPNQTMLLEQFKKLPVVVFSSITYDARQRVTTTTIFRKDNGKRVFDKSLVNNNVQWHTLLIDASKGLIELIGYQSKIQVQVK
ncbi:MAG: hypothetical protein KatS3mg105_1437 [Gemmatales bacterium]|nr:MAG: hypothetical protein KatS3mg105_1437 [Gemmatales bacterium]